MTRRPKNGRSKAPKKCRAAISRAPQLTLRVQRFDVVDELTATHGVQECGRLEDVGLG